MPKRHKKKLRGALDVQLKLLGDAATSYHRDESSGGSPNSGVVSTGSTPHGCSSDLSVSPPRTELLYLNKSSHNYSSICNLQVLFQTSYYDGRSPVLVENCNAQTQTDGCTSPPRDTHCGGTPRISPDEVSFFTPQLYVRKHSTPITQDEGGANTTRHKWETPKLSRTIRRRSLKSTTPKRHLRRPKKTHLSFADKTPPVALFEFLKKIWQEMRKCARAALALLRVFVKVGITIKTGLFSLYCTYSRKSTPSDGGCNHCKDYSERVKQLQDKMVDLENRLQTEQRGHEERLQNEMVTFKKHLNQQMVDLRQEVESLKARHHNSSENPSDGANIGNPSGLRPPPPPPPLPTLLFTAATPTLTITRKKPGGRDTDKNRRPVISLEEILNVRLRKTTERSPYARRSTVPCLQQEFLKDIKLKRTIRPMTPALPDVPSTSSNDSLIRILTNSDNNVRRVKRLKRTDGYSFDDVCRRNALARRERERVQ